MRINSTKVSGWLERSGLIVKRIEDLGIYQEQRHFDVEFANGFYTRIAITMRNIYFFVRRDGRLCLSSGKIVSKMARNVKKIRPRIS